MAIQKVFGVACNLIGGQNEIIERLKWRIEKLEKQNNELCDIIESLSPNYLNDYAYNKFCREYPRANP